MTSEIVVEPKCRGTFLDAYWNWWASKLPEILDVQYLSVFIETVEIIWKAICHWLLWRADIVLGYESSSGEPIYHFPLFSTRTTTQRGSSALPRAWTNYANFICGFQGPRVLKNLEKNPLCNNNCLHLQGWYIVTYALGIYQLNLFIAFLTPKIDPALDELGESDIGVFISFYF